MAYVVALTGGIGSGKSTVASAFIKLGVTVIDADIISRKAVEFGTPALCSIADHFGTDIINTDNTLNRRLLRKRVFSSYKEKDWLDALLHPIIYQETQRRIEQVTSSYVLWVVPLLVENQLHRKTDRILVVDVTPEIQIKRTMMRDGVSRKHVNQILATQATRKERLAIAYDVIDNNGTPDTIISEVAHLHSKYILNSISQSRK